jgi:1,4-dihydroxy-2-naphthoate octaprenyltransferase
MATAAEWVSGARPRTLPLAVGPVVLGTGAAIGITGHWRWESLVRALLALVVSLALQVAVNYANDYSDGVRGTDDERVGPFRLTGSRAAQPAAVKRAAFTSFAVAGVAGLVLIVLSGTWWLLTAGLACVLAAWYYTGGRRPYGYAGLGEVSVFVFFGLVAVLGTAYTQAGRVTWSSVAAAVGAGALACAVLVANNLRDVPTDSVAGKRTVAVRIGISATRVLYVALVALAFLAALLVVPFHPWALLTLLAVPAARPPTRTVLEGAEGLALLPELRDTGRLSLAYAVLLAVGLAL